MEWGELHKLSVRNECDQGKVLVALAYWLHCKELFETLRRRHSGCCRGIFGYSYDNWVLAPSLFAFQEILKACKEFATSHNLKFSTDTQMHPLQATTNLIII